MALNDQEFGGRLKGMRTRRKMSQSELADLCGWENQSRVAGYETHSREPSRADVCAMAKALSVDPGWLFFGGAPVDRSNDRAPLRDDEARLLELYKSLASNIKPLAHKILRSLI